MWIPRDGKRAPAQTQSGAQLRPARCKAMFAELSDYLDEQLDESLCEEIERHMSDCGPCQAFLATLEATIEQLRKPAADSALPENTSKLRNQLMQDHRRVIKLLGSSS
jgi:anti-sigma factor RsiW